MKKQIYFITACIALSFLTAWSQNPKYTSETLLDLEQLEEVRRASSVGEEPMLSCYIKFNTPETADKLRSMGVKVDAVAKTVLTARVPIGLIEEVAKLDEVECIQSARPAWPALDKSLADTRVAEVHSTSNLGEINTPFTGKGVMVGAIDGGLDFTHVAFYDSERKNLRIKSVWVHDDNTGKAPEGFSYGTELTTPEELLKKKSDLSYYSHGTHVMNIAAGNNLSSPYHGIAYDADIVFSNFTEIDKGISDGLTYLCGKADKAGKPIVINMSLGTQMGPHDGASLRDVIGDELSGAGKILVGASGNDGLVNMHISKTFTAEDNQLLAGMGFLAETAGMGELQVWGQPGKSLKVRVCTIDKETKEPVYQSRNFDCSKSTNQTVTLQKPFDQSGGFFKIITQISPLNNKPMAHITLGIEDYKPGKVIAIMISGEEGSTVHAWANNNQCCFLRHLDTMGIPDHDYGVCEIGGTGKEIITVGSYNTKNKVEVLKGDPSVTEFTVGDISPFSNVGPTADGRLKPDVAAPGSLIVSAFNSSTSNDPAVVAMSEWDGKKYPYGVYQGTSMASPHTAGIIALWLQAAPELTPSQVRTTLEQTARHDEQTGPIAGNVWGRGKIDAYAGLVYVLKNYAGKSAVADAVSEEKWNLNIIDGQARVLHYLDCGSTEINVYSVSGARVLGTKATGSGTGDELVMSLDKLEPGVYIVEALCDGKRKTLKYSLR